MIDKNVSADISARHFEREAFIDSMCLTWRHDFGLERDGDDALCCGMTPVEREALRRNMAQIYEHHVSPLCAALSQQAGQAVTLTDTEIHALARKHYLLIAGESAASVTNFARALLAKAAPVAAVPVAWMTADREYFDTEAQARADEAERGYAVRPLYTTPPAVDARQGDGEHFCYCDEEISLQTVSGGASKDGLYGRVTLKVGDEYVEYVRASSSRVEVEMVDWAVSRWVAEVKDRPLNNIHRRTLDDTWRQVIRQCGGDAEALLGPTHDAMLAAAEAPKGGAA